MLTPNQQNYLATIPQEKIAHIKPFNPRVKKVGEMLVSKIKTLLPELEVVFIGATALGIAGQNDIDLNILSTPGEYKKYLPKIKELFGEPTQTNQNLIKWEFVQNGFEIELYLTDKNSPLLKAQIETFEILRQNPALIREYEKIKIESDGQPFRMPRRAAPSSES